jgi:hypothetical protein
MTRGLTDFAARPLPIGMGLRIGLLLAALAPQQSEAQQVWRCGAEGNSYSQVPCTDGRAVAVADERSDAQRLQSLEVAQRQHQMADQLVRERKAREAPPASLPIHPPKTQPVKAQARPQPTLVKAARRQKPAKPGTSKTTARASLPRLD